MYKIYSLTKNLATILVIAFLTAPDTTFAKAFDFRTACANAAVVEPGTIYRGYADDLETPHLLSLEVVSAGILTLGVISSDVRSVETRLGFMNGGCRDGDSVEGDFVTVERSAARLVLAIHTPGLYTFRLDVKDARQTSGEFELTSRFIPAAVVTEELSFGPEPSDTSGAQPARASRTRFYALGARLGTRDSMNEGEEHADPGDGFTWTGHDSMNEGEEHADPGDGLTGTGHDSMNEGEEHADPGDGVIWQSGTDTGRLLLSIVELRNADSGSFMTRLILTYDTASETDRQEIEALTLIGLAQELHGADW